MPIPGLTGPHTFADWMKVDYAKAGRPTLLVTPENGGLLSVSFLAAGQTYGVKVDFHKHRPRHRRHSCSKCEYTFIEHERDEHVPPQLCPNHADPLYQSEWIVGAEEEMP